MSRWKVAGINFDHFHMLDNLRMAHAHPDVEIVGLCDEQLDRVRSAASELSVPADRVYADYRQCLEETRPDLVLLCPTTAEHGLWTERVAEYGVHILMEKPFAASLAEADRMIAAMRAVGRQLAINWPLAWYPPHRTAKRLIDEGRIGTPREVHFYDGNRGPLWHTAGKAERSAADVQAEKPQSWFYRRDQGGGSLLDYLGYGTTLGTWYLGGQKPLEVMSLCDEPSGLEVDEHSVTIARYACGLSKFETRWGTYSDPWTHQPQPKCGFVIVGSAGTISSYDYEATIRIQTAANPAGDVVPVDELQPPQQNPVQYFLDCLTRQVPVDGPLSVETCRIGQQIVDTAYQSATQKRALPLLP
ncbi:MAG: Gfo/Idh/MocA family oxidoreductase [Planctomycetales bacterium]|nr:Gfo/Idh/MocA family oxidoreductase [Planctomycetales bacterium]